MRKMLNVVLLMALTAIGFLSSQAFAVGPDFTTLTTGVDFSTIGPALLLIAVAISGVYVIWKGAKMILSAIKSA